MTEIVAYLAQKGSTMKVSVVDPNRSGTQMSFNAHQISIDDTPIPGGLQTHTP